MLRLGYVNPPKIIRYSTENGWCAGTPGVKDILQFEITIFVSDERWTKTEPSLKNRQNVQDLKLWPRELLSFLSMVYSSCEAKNGGELDGASLFWGRVQLACGVTWLCEPISGRPPWASLPSHPGWGPPGSSKSLFSPEGSSANLVEKGKGDEIRHLQTLSPGVPQEATNL